MLIMLGVLIQDVQLLIGVCFLALHLFPGRARNRIVSPSLLQSPSTGQCPKLVQKYFGYMGSLLSLVFNSVPLLLFMLIIQVSFTLPLILSSMSASSILRWIGTSFMMCLRLGLYLFLMCPAIFRWLTSSPKLSHASVIIFLRTN